MQKSPLVGKTELRGVLSMKIQPYLGEPWPLMFGGLLPGLLETAPGNDTRRNPEGEQARASTALDNSIIKGDNFVQQFKPGTVTAIVRHFLSHT